MALENLNNKEELVFNSNSGRELYFKSLAESVPHFILLVEPVTYKIVYINRVRPLTKMEDIIGKSVFDFVWPEYALLLKDKFNEVIQSKNPGHVEAYARSSQDLNLKTCYQSQISLILDENGDIKHFILSVEDISEKKRIETETINKSEKIKAIINNTRDMILSIDSNFKLSEFNSVFSSIVKMGYGVDLEPGMEVLQFIDPTKHEKLRDIYNKVLKGETNYAIDSFQTLTGHVVYNETSYHPIYNAEKEITGISIFSKDITERVKTEQKIINALKEKEVLLSEIHHRIKNNLAMVSSLLQLQEMNIENAEAKEALILSQKRIKSTALIHELLYKNESLAQIQLKEYLVTLFSHLNINENIKLKLSGNEVLLDINTAMPLGLMLNELLLNSFKHCYDASSKGELEISTVSSNNNLLIQYKDFAGQFPESLDFYNSNTTGLTLIHTFVEQLSGQIALKEQKPAYFTIQIPLLDAN